MSPSIPEVDKVLEELDSNKPDSVKVKENLEIFRSSTRVMDEIVRDVIGEGIETLTGFKPHQISTLEGIVNKVEERGFEDEDFKELYRDQVGLEENKILGEINGIKDVHQTWMNSRDKIDDLFEDDLKELEEGRLENLEKVQDNKRYIQWVKLKKKVLDEVESELEEAKAHLDRGESKVENVEEDDDVKESLSEYKDSERKKERLEDIRRIKEEVESKMGEVRQERERFEGFHGDALEELEV